MDISAVLLGAFWALLSIAATVAAFLWLFEANYREEVKARKRGDPWPPEPDDTEYEKFNLSRVLVMAALLALVLVYGLIGKVGDKF